MDVEVTVVQTAAVYAIFQPDKWVHGIGVMT